MKCLLCGKEKFFKVKIIDNQVIATEGYVSQTVDAYACENCGHVELFVSQDVINKHFQSIREENEKQERRKLLQDEITRLKSEIKKLTEIVADENQTVKTVNEAKLKLKELQNELNRAEDRLDGVVRPNRITFR